MKKRLLLISGLLFIVAASQAQTWPWVQQSEVLWNIDLIASNVATNRTGNVYQTGGYSSYVFFVSTILRSQAQEDVFLTKYDPNGNVLWAQTSVGTKYGSNTGYSVATDDSDNAYVEGIGFNSSQPDTVYFWPYTLFLPAGGYSFLVKYNPDGKVLWAKQPDTTVVPVGNAGLIVNTDKFGHEYITGDGAFLLKYDRNGNLKWSVSKPTNFRPLVGISSVYATGLSTDAFGNIFMSGFFGDTLTLGNNILYSPNKAQFVAKFDSSGNVLWAQQTNDNGVFKNYNPYDIPYNSITVDRNNAAYLTGTYIDSIKFGNTLLTNIDSFTNTFFVVKFNPGGSVAWAKQATALHNSSLNGWLTYSISSDDSNHIYLVGTPTVNGSGSESQFIFANKTISLLDTAVYDEPVFMLKLDSTGNILCSTTITAGGFAPDAITSSPSGQFVYIGGEFFQDFYISNTLMSVITSLDNSFIGRWQSCYTCNLSVTAPLSPSVCNGDSTLLTISGAVSYTWAPSAGLSSTTGDSVMAAPTLTTTYTVTYSDYGCGDSAQCVVTVKQPPSKPIITVSVTGDTLYSSARNGNQWFFNDTLITGATDSFYVITGRPKGRYYVVVTNIANGCNITSDSTTGVNQLAVNSKQLSVYPNPFSNQLTVSSLGLAEIDEIDVTNELGQVLFISPSNLGNKNTIDMSDLPAGIYFIAVLTKTARTVVPVVKE